MSNTNYADTNAWRQVTLDDVCLRIQDGAHHSPKVVFREGGAGRYLYITSKNIRNNVLDLSNVSYVDHAFHDLIYPRCTPEIGDVLLTKDGANTGNVTLNTISEPSSLLSSVALIKTKTTVLKPKYLSYYFQSPERLNQITGQMTGTAIKRVILRDLKAAKIPLPPLREQERIVTILDQAFDMTLQATLVTNANLLAARLLLSQQLINRFNELSNTKPLIRIANAVKTASGGTPLKLNKSYYNGRNIPWILSGEVSQGSIERPSHFTSTFSRPTIWWTRRTCATSLCCARWGT